jgi:predicted Zn-dependent protease
MVAGGVAGGGGASELGNAGQGVLYGGNEIVMRGLLAERRNQESAADQAGLSFLNATKQSGRGMLETFERFAQQEYISDAQKDSFARSHPLSRERLARLRTLVESSPYYNAKDPPQLQLRHDLMRAKLSGFLERPDTVMRRYPPSDQSLPARYARAISTYRHGDLRQAIAQIDGLIKTAPNNPYFHELKGQALLEGGHPAEAVAPLRQAAAMSHHAPLISILLAQALIATNNASVSAEAIGLLDAALRIEPEAPGAYDQLAMAYGRKGDLAHADLASAQAAFTRGDVKTARQLASRAKTRLPVGSPAWVRADDIVNVKPPKTDKP